MKLSVVVASYNSPATLDQCLAALPEDVEVIVADCSDRDPRESFRIQFPHVRFLRFGQKLTIPELRREALRMAGGDVVAFTEGRMVPSANWVEVLREAHSRHPHAPAIGGAIDHQGDSAFDTAVFLCEYGQHAAPAADGEAGELSGANLSYKRWAIDIGRDLIEAGAWEPFLHRRLKGRGHRLLRAGRAIVTYHNSLTPRQFARQRFHYGRWFAAARVAGAWPPQRLLYAVFCPLLPVLLTARLARRRGFVRALPRILLFQTIWAAGEFCGYVAGKGTSGRQVF